MRKKLLSILVCPKCKGKLEYKASASQLVCNNDNLIFPVRNGTPVLLEMDATIASSDNKK